MPITPPALVGDTIFMGAAHIGYDTSSGSEKYIWCEGDATVELKRTDLDVPVSGFGQITNPSTDEVVEVKFTPASRVDSSILSWMFGSLFSARPGASYFGSSSHPLWVHTMDGRVLKISNCLPTSWPTLNFGVSKRRWDGEVTCTGILARGQARTASNALFTPWANLSWSKYPAEDAVPHQVCEVKWAGIGSGATVLQAMEGWSLSVQPSLAPLTVSNLGTIDYRVQDVVVEVSAIPANAAEADLWGTAALGASRALGTPQNGGQMTLMEDYPGLCATLPNMVWVDRPTRFDPANPIAGQCRWRSRRKHDGTSWNSIATLAMAAAPQNNG